MLETVAWRVSAKAVGYRFESPSSELLFVYCACKFRGGRRHRGDLGSLVVTIDAFGFVKIVEIRFVT